MPLDKVFLEEEFKKYYRKTGLTATHVFLYSKEQEGICRREDLITGREWFANTVFGKKYTECCHRDFGQVYDKDKYQFVSVGSYADIKIN
jgi:hypothetical protein